MLYRGVKRTVQLVESISLLIAYALNPTVDVHTHKMEEKRIQGRGAGETVDNDAAAGVHRLVLLHGRQRAREMVPLHRRPLVDIAAEVLSDETQAVGVSYTGFCLTSLPHKRLPDDQAWKKAGHRVSLVVEPGHMLFKGEPRLYGVPFGARARMVLLYLQTQAVRTGSREVELGRSMRAWLERMGVSVGGETAKAFREQATRISACSLKFFWEGDRRSVGWSAGRIVTSGLSFHALEANGQESLWEERVELDATFYKALREHPVPILEAAIRQLRDRSMSLDLYVWLAWRLHTLERETPISWPSIFGQFGEGYRELRHFKPRFVEALGAAVAAYPESRVELDDNGIKLRPSRPPIAKREIV